MRRLTRLTGALARTAARLFRSFRLRRRCAGRAVLHCRPRCGRRPRGRRPVGCRSGRRLSGRVGQVLPGSARRGRGVYLGGGCGALSASLRSSAAELHHQERCPRARLERRRAGRLRRRQMHRRRPVRKLRRTSAGRARREYHECDIDTLHAASRGAKRIVYSNDGLIYYTEDHYESFILLYGEE